MTKSLHKSGAPMIELGQLACDQAFNSLRFI